MKVLAVLSVLFYISVHQNEGPCCTERVVLYFCPSEWRSLLYWACCFIFLSLRMKVLAVLSVLFYISVPQNEGLCCTERVVLYFCPSEWRSLLYWACFIFLFIRMKVLAVLSVFLVAAVVAAREGEKREQHAWMESFRVQVSLSVCLSVCSFQSIRCSKCIISLFSPTRRRYSTWQAFLITPLYGSRSKTWNYAKK